ncbi:MAG TPA: hypothetical protein PK156_16075 [Polyangium sp.]|nr:hypothetical protein [Polyangium sp.]
MGENFLKRKNDRFIRQRDQRFNEYLAPDLFSLCPTESEITLLASVHEGACVADELWAPTIDLADPIELYCGDRLVARIDGTEADLLRQEFGNRGVPVIAKIVELDEGIAHLKIIEGKVK